MQVDSHGRGPIKDVQKSVGDNVIDSGQGRRRRYNSCSERALSSAEQPETRASRASPLMGCVFSLRASCGVNYTESPGILMEK